MTAAEGQLITMNIRIPGLLGPGLLLLAPLACSSGSVTPPTSTSVSDSGTGDSGDDSGSTTAVSAEDSGNDESTAGPGPVCGDGVVEGDEVCDDGGESATCNADCTAASCGDGVVNRAAGEICDDAGRSDLCNDDCTSALCGDSVVNAAAGEECDDGGFSIGCDDDCTFAECGDGTYNPNAGELCDEGLGSPTCDPDCTFVTCGDGVTNEAAGEECDEMGQTMTCNPDCTAVICGDGLINVAAGEECDDGGESATCDIDCTFQACGDGTVNVTAGEQCDDMGESALCDVDCTDALCGDGLVNPTAGETCDDGNTGISCLPGCTPCPLGEIFNEDFSDNSAGWTLGTEWAIGSAVASVSPGSCGNGDPGTDHSPTADNGIAGAVIGGNVTTTLHDYYYLTSPVINTGGYIDLQLELWRWLNSDYTRFMNNVVEVWDGAAWQQVWQSGPAPNVEDAAWTNVSYDVSAYTNPNMQIRIGHNVDSAGVYTCSGWNVDDLILIGPACP